MTEAEWLACTAPGPMVDFVRRMENDRKLRLFACACCRRMWHLLTDERSRRVVEMAEGYADGRVNKEDRSAARKLALDVMATTATGPEAQAAQLTAARRTADSLRVCLYAVNAITQDAFHRTWTALKTAKDFERSARAKQAEAEARIDELAAQANLLRCIFGNPFRPVPASDPAWLAWQDGTVPKLAASIYEERRFADLPILADALEEAGCGEEAVLSHCRGDSEHARGCWVLDWVLGRK